MTLHIWLQEATAQLIQQDIATARLDALVLLEDALQKDRSWILANPEFILQENHLQTLAVQITRRSKHEPLAYIRGKSEFYGREFIVSPATLQPRPETETIITLLQSLDLAENDSYIADIGTGSGAIAITAKLEHPGAVVYATEIQADALAVAQKNAQALDAEVKLLQGDLLEPLTDAQVGVVLANLPYVPDSHTINQAAMQEPAVAIFGGEDGLDLYRRMFEQIDKRAQKPAHVLTESLPFQHKDVAKIAAAHGYELKTTEDFIQVFTAAN